MILPARSSGARTSLSSGTASTHFAGLRLARLYSSSHTSTTSPALPFSTIQSWPVSPQSTIPSTTYRLISCARKSTAAILSSSKRGKTLRSAIEMRYPALPNRSTVAPCRLPLGSPMRSDEGGSLSVIWILDFGFWILDLEEQDGTVPFNPKSAIQNPKSSSLG